MTWQRVLCFDTRKPEDSPASIPIIFEDKMSGVAIVDGGFGIEREVAFDFALPLITFS